jgi:hypothetical protein
MAKLKVFRTPIGFHDAYVAATSRKAALVAWGADRDLFARGVAEEVTEASLMKAPLAAPGEVIRVSRGTVAEQLAALPDARPKAAKKGGETASKAQDQSKPKPSRRPLDKAEQALAKAKARHEAEGHALAEAEAALERRRRDLRRAQAAELRTLEDARGSAEAAYKDALAKWRR